MFQLCSLVQKVQVSSNRSKKKLIPSTGKNILSTGTGSFNQLMVNWWFGLVGWIPRIPLWKGLLLRGIPRIPNHQSPSHQFIISWIQQNPSKIKVISCNPEISQGHEKKTSQGTRFYHVLPTKISRIPSQKKQIHQDDGKNPLTTNRLTNNTPEN